VGAGLSPGDASSVAPMGIPAGETGEPGAMPSGEVAPILGIGLPIPPTCANAGMQPKSAACIAAINTRRTMISIVRAQRSGRLVNHNIDAASVTDVSAVASRTRSRKASSPNRNHKRSQASNRHGGDCQRIKTFFWLGKGDYGPNRSAIAIARGALG
jgi:hypothetical protein